jgi:hypothetical protein
MSSKVFTFDAATASKIASVVSHERKPHWVMSRSLMRKDGNQFATAMTPVEVMRPTVRLVRLVSAEKRADIGWNSRVPGFSFLTVRQLSIFIVDAISRTMSSSSTSPQLNQIS